MKTATISLRVPVDFKANLQSICDTQKVSMTELCLSRLTPVSQIAPIDAVVLQKLSKGGMVKDNGSNIVISEEFGNMLAIGGGSAIGILVYKTLKLNLQRHNPEWTDAKIEGIAFASALASALLSGFGIHQLTKSLRGKK